MPRPQFSLKTMLWLMAVVAAFCAGFQFHKVITWRYTLDYLNEHEMDVPAWEHAASEYWRLRDEHERQP